MLSVTCLGTSAARPTVERNVSSLAMVREGETLMFDCGEGTQRQMMRYGIAFSLEHIYITHYHADHFLGVTGLLRTLGLQGRTEPLHLYGPKGAERILGSVVSLGVERPPFEISITELAPGDTVDWKEFNLEIFPTEHARHSIGYALVEHERLGRFHPERAQALGIPEGPLWGELHRGETVKLSDGRTVNPSDLVDTARPGRKVVYTGDTKPCKSVVDAAHGADLLIHEATFGDEEQDRAAETAHSTAAGAAQVALAAQVRKLVLCHVSARYSRDARPLEQQARQIFPNAEVARDGTVIDVPFQAG